jgi:hypothetical protein
MMGVNGRLARQLLGFLSMDLARPSAWFSTIPDSSATPRADCDGSRPLFAGRDITVAMPTSRYLSWRSDGALLNLLIK